MPRTLAFPVPDGVIEGLDFVLAERPKVAPSTLSRDAFLSQLVQEAGAAGLRRLKGVTRLSVKPVALSSGR